MKERNQGRMPVANIDAALRAYYGNGYIGNDEIREIFGTDASSTIWRMKRQVQEAEKAKGIPMVVPRQVNVKVAFEVWNIDIKELERNRKKLIELGLVG